MSVGAAVRRTLEEMSVILMSSHASQSLIKKVGCVLNELVSYMSPPTATEHLTNGRVVLQKTIDIQNVNISKKFYAGITTSFYLVYLNNIF